LDCSGQDPLRTTGTNAAARFRDAPWNRTGAMAENWAADKFAWDVRRGVVW